MVDKISTCLLLKRKLSLLSSFSLVFLDLQMKLYLLLANAAKWLQQRFRPVICSIRHLHICIKEERVSTSAKEEQNQEQVKLQKKKQLDVPGIIKFTKSLMDLS